MVLRVRAVSAGFATQTEIREAARADDDVELHCWVALGLMPDPRRLGANRNRWPPWAVERARWIRAQLEQGASLGAIAEFVRHGLGVPSPPLLDDPAPDPVRIELDSFDLGAAERRLCQEASSAPARWSAPRRCWASPVTR